MLKTYKYRIYPNKPEQRLMDDTLETCRLLYNRILAVRRDAWKQEQKSLSTRDTQALLPAWKREDERLKQVYSQVLQNVNERVGIAFDRFFQKAGEGESHGFPRFKGKNRCDSFCYPQHSYAFKTKDGQTKFGYAFSVQREGQIDYLYMAKIGRVKIMLHHPLPERIKTLTLKRSRTGKWFATFVCEVEPEIRLPANRLVGIDLGLHNYAAFSDGTVIPNPRFFRQEEKALAKAQRKYSAVLQDCKAYWDKGEHPPLELQHERKRLGKVVCRIHERIANRRDDFCHQLSRDVVDGYDLIVLEALNPKGMSEGRNRGLNKSIRDAAWGKTCKFILSKAEEAGKEWVQVNPRYTSQMCSSCGQHVPKDLRVRMHECPYCGLVIDRDVNAALNILALGLQGGGTESSEAAIFG